jgi:menaquinone-dependent protoporphyrinogen IX oxidase
MKKALIVYGTRYGAAASTAEEIAKIFGQQGLDVRVVNAKDEKVKDITEYDLVVVGSGIQIDRWTGEPENFLKNFQKDLAKKKVALFVCCGSASQELNKGKPGTVARAKRKYLDEKAAKYNLQPIALGLFGGVYNYNKQPWWAKKALDAERPKIEAAYKETQPRIYDTRDWNALRTWAKELAQSLLS